MGKSNDPRHLRRKKIVQNLFAASLNEAHILASEVKEIVASFDKLDPIIEKSAPEWPIDKLNHVDLAILRLAVYELTVDRGVPEKVIVDEAVELAKELGSESSPAFVNGVLGSILENNATKN
ncbi:MAG: transcription antitermination factor NusB [bacterium]|nr:transcription antitermination factor NusB [bacterium]